MSCEFQSLYFGDDGYVVRCKNCGHYQLAFLCIMITLKAENFSAFCRMIIQRSKETNQACAEHSKCVLIETPASNVSFILTKGEADRFAEILEQAGDEMKALSLLQLFDTSY